MRLFLPRHLPPLGDEKRLKPDYHGAMNAQPPTTIAYRIRLHGKLDEESASWFPELSHTEDSDGNALLTGKLADQSALLGVLFRIHNLNLQILSVNRQFFNDGESHDGNLKNA